MIAKGEYPGKDLKWPESWRVFVKSVGSQAEAGRITGVGSSSVKHYYYDGDIPHGKNHRKIEECLGWSIPALPSTQPGAITAKDEGWREVLAWLGAYSRAHTDYSELSRPPVSFQQKRVAGEERKVKAAFKRLRKKGMELGLAEIIAGHIELWKGA